MTTLADVNAVISASREMANTFAEKSLQAARSAQSAAQGSVGLPYAPTVSAPGIPFRPAYQGNIDLSSELRAAYNEALRELRPEFSNGLAEYIARWFPQCVTNTTNDWICDTILNGGTGIPAPIENAIWQRARERELLEAKRMEQEALTQLTTKGFSIPTGALTARLLAVQQEAASKSASLSRDISIKQAEIEIENIRFAVTEGVKVRISVLNAIGDYLRAWMLPETLAIDKAKAIATSKATLMNSAADYYRAGVAEAELSVRAGEANARIFASMAEAQATLWQSGNQLQANVGANIATAFGQTAASAASSILGVAQSAITGVPAS